MRNQVLILVIGEEGCKRRGNRSLLDITVDLSIDGGESRPLLPKEARAEPFDVLLWAANELSRRGIGLKAGHIVTPGLAQYSIPAGAQP